MAAFFFYSIEKAVLILCKTVEIYTPEGWSYNGERFRFLRLFY